MLTNFKILTAHLLLTVIKLTLDSEPIVEFVRSTAIFSCLGVDTFDTLFRSFNDKLLLSRANNFPDLLLKNK